MALTISVIIPAINEEDTIGAAVSSAWAAGADEVIVADGGSSDDTVHRANQANARVTSGEAGRAEQQNAGAALAHCDVLLFQHADCRLAQDCLRQIREHLSCSSKTVHGGFQQHIDARGIAFRLLEIGNAFRSRWLGLTYGDQAIFVRRDLFHRVNGFPRVELMEDVILMRRLRPHGLPTLLPGPLHVSARRWRRRGVIIQTVQNWLLLTAYFCGVSPSRLGNFYRRHDV